MKTTEILTIIAISSMGLSLICSLVVIVLKKGNDTYGKARDTFIFLSIVLLTVSQFVREESERYGTSPAAKPIIDGSGKVTYDALYCQTPGGTPGGTKIQCKVEGIKKDWDWGQGCNNLFLAGKDEWKWGGIMQTTSNTSLPYKPGTWVGTNMTNEKGVTSACTKAYSGEYLNVVCNDPLMNQQCEKCNAYGIITFTTPHFKGKMTVDADVFFQATKNSKKIRCQLVNQNVKNDKIDKITVDFDLSLDDVDPTSPCDGDKFCTTPPIMGYLTINGDKKLISEKIGSLSGCKGQCDKDPMCFYPDKMVCYTKEWGQNCTMLNGFCKNNYDCTNPGEVCSDHKCIKYIPKKCVKDSDCKGSYCDSAPPKTAPFYCKTTPPTYPRPMTTGNNRGLLDETEPPTPTIFAPLFPLPSIHL